MPALSVVVEGRVQGVGFRAFVEDLALELGVVGEVWNRRDGAVELVAQHPSDSVLADLVGRLRGGPGRVLGVSATARSESSFDGFSIGWTR